MSHSGLPFIGLALGIGMILGGVMLSSGSLSPAEAGSSLPPTPAVLSSVLPEGDHVHPPSEDQVEAAVSVLLNSPELQSLGVVGTFTVERADPWFTDAKAPLGVALSIRFPEPISGMQRFIAMEWLGESSPATGRPYERWDVGGNVQNMSVAHVKVDLESNIVAQLTPEDESSVISFGIAPYALGD